MGTSKSAAQFILILVILGFISGCDVYRFVAWTFDQNTNAKLESTSQTVDQGQLFLQMSDFLDEYGKSHSLNCLHPLGPDIRVCNNSYTTLQLNKYDDGKVVLKITQIGGPIKASGDYYEIRNELLKLLAKRFPQVHVTNMSVIQ